MLPVGSRHMGLRRLSVNRVAGESSRDPHISERGLHVFFTPIMAEFTHSVMDTGALEFCSGLEPPASSPVAVAGLCLYPAKWRAPG